MADMTGDWEKDLVKSISSSRKVTKAKDPKKDNGSIKTALIIGYLNSPHLVN